MYQLMQRRNIWFTISAIMIVPGLIFMIFSMVTRGTPLPLNIDYTGGTLWELRFAEPLAPADLRQIFVEAGYADTTAFTVDDELTLQVKFKDILPEEKEVLIANIENRFGTFEERSYRSIGPSVGAEVARAAVGAVAVAAIFILLYIAWAFRQVPHPTRYGSCAVIALVHDVLVTISFIGIMNWLVGWEVDAIFLTAILTVIGKSVNDTIVVFDRIRENLRRYRTERYITVANRSLLETLQRSIGTQITVLLIMVALLLFGGATLRQFVATMMVGMIAGTYSSIFVAPPLLVAWEQGTLFGNRSRRTPVADGTTATA
ncbi:MAG: protein translocase subunit SecF [Litorilinea sp.]